MQIVVKLNINVVSGNIGEEKIDVNALVSSVKNLPPPKNLNKSKLFRGKYLKNDAPLRNMLKIEVTNKQRIDTVVDTI